MTRHFRVRFGTVSAEKMVVTAHEVVEARTIQVREDVEGESQRFIVRYWLTWAVLRTHR